VTSSVHYEGQDRQKDDFEQRMGYFVNAMLRISDLVADRTAVAI
jgi:hypothetical protein